MLDRVIKILLIVLLVLCITSMILQIMHEIKSCHVLDSVRATDNRLNEYIDKIYTSEGDGEEKKNGR